MTHPTTTNADDVTVRRGPPREEASESAIEWVCERLTNKQLAALRALASDRISTTAAGLGVNANTLWSLNDFRRGERGVMAPLSLVTSDWNWEGKREWRLTRFGSAVHTIALSLAIKGGE